MEFLLNDYVNPYFINSDRLGKLKIIINVKVNWHTPNFIDDIDPFNNRISSLIKDFLTNRFINFHSEINIAQSLKIRHIIILYFYIKNASNKADLRIRNYDDIV